MTHDRTESVDTQHRKGAEAVATLVAAPSALAPAAEILRAEMQRETELRAVLKEYLAKNMIPGLHYYWLSEKDREDGRKPSLSKDGALNLAGLYHCRPQPEDPGERFHDGGHYSVPQRVHLVNVETGAIAATGDGFATTRESKYRYRWLWPSDVEQAGLDKAALPKRTIKTTQGRVPQYRIENENPADQQNTVVKMAFKRALVAAALQLPVVSELFTQDLEEQLEGDREAKAARATAEEGAAKPLSRKDLMAAIQEAATTAGLTRDQLKGKAQEILGKPISGTGAAGLTDAELMRIVGALERDVQEQADAAAAAFDPFANGEAATAAAVRDPEAAKAAMAAEKVFGESPIRAASDAMAQALSTEEPPIDRATAERRVADAADSLGWITEADIDGFALKFLGKIRRFMVPLELDALAAEMEGRALAGGTQRPEDPEERA